MNYKSIMIKIYNKRDFEKMKVAGSLTAKVLNALDDFIDVGTTTQEIDDFCSKMIIDGGGISACLNYNGYPKNVCTSINDVICHGIPDNTKLQDGDIINVDVTSIVDGYFGDASKMYMVGKSFKEHKQENRKKLVQVAKECLEIGIKYARPGNKLLEIGKHIQEHAERNGFSVVRDFCGHGCGKVFHDEPNVLHYLPSIFERRFFDITLKPGMIFTIEPMINAGDWKMYVDKHNGWTARTKDGSDSAQWEHTIGITEDKCIIFTKE